MIIYFVFMVGLAMFAVGIAGLATSKHLIIMVAAAEIALLSSAIVAVSNYGTSDYAGLLDFLFVIWTIAAVEIMCLIAFYRYMVKERMSLDVSKLSDFGER
jgi:NADH:ubiquinone oxidoreductase subunit K